MKPSANPVPTDQPSEQPTDFKTILASKTIWVNLMAIVAFVVQAKYGYVIDENTQFAALSAINIILRFVTHKPVKW